MNGKTYLLALSLILPFSSSTYAEEETSTVGVGRFSYSENYRGAMFSNSAAAYMCGESINMSVDACLGVDYTWHGAGSADPKSIFFIYEANTNTNPQFYGSVGMDLIGAYKQWLYQVLSASVSPEYAYRYELGVRMKIGDMGLSLSQVRYTAFSTLAGYRNYQATIYWYIR